MKPTAKDLAFSVVDIFEDLLDEKNIDIPCADTHEEEDRHDHENTANTMLIKASRCIRCWTVLLGIWQSTWSEWTTRTTCELPAGISSGH